MVEEIDGTEFWDYVERSMQTMILVATDASQTIQQSDGIQCSMRVRTSYGECFLCFKDTHVVIRYTSCTFSAAVAVAYVPFRITRRRLLAIQIS